jgi:hypothetical protein
VNRLTLVAIFAGLATLVATQLSADDVAPAPDSDVTVKFVKGYKSGLGVSGAQIYSYSGDACSTINRTDKLSWWTGSSRTISVKAEHRVYVAVTTIYFYSSGATSYGYGIGVNVANWQCSDTGNFIPEPGHSYAVTEDAVLKGQCQLRVLDEQTGSQPASFNAGFCHTNRNAGGGIFPQSDAPAAQQNNDTAPHQSSGAAAH